MSADLMFYALKKNENNELEPFICVDGEYRCFYMIGCSGLDGREMFTDGDYIFQDLRCHLTDNTLHFTDEAKKLVFGERYEETLSEDTIGSQNIYTIACLKDIPSGTVLRQGYIKNKDYRMLQTIDPSERLDYIKWQMESMVSADYVAELPKKKRKKYCHYAYIDPYTYHGVCATINDIIYGICSTLFWSKLKEEDIYIVCEYTN